MLEFDDSFFHVPDQASSGYDGNLLGMTPRREYDEPEQELPPEEQTEEERTWGEALQDTAIGLTQGSIDFVTVPYEILDLISSGALERTTGFGQENIQRSQDILEGLKSGALQERERRVAESDGFMETVGTSLSEPSTIMQGVVRSVPSMLGPMGLGRAGGTMAAKGLTGEAAEQAMKKGATRGATAGIMATEGGLNAFQAKQQVLSTDPAQLYETSQDFRDMVDGGMGIEEAQGRLADNVAQMTMAITAPIAGVAGRVTGAAKFEGGLGAGLPTVAGGMPTRALGGAMREGSEETIQSGTGQAAQNIAQQQYVDPTQDVMEGVGQAAGVGLTTGTAMGAGMGAISKKPAVAVNEQGQPVDEDGQLVGPMPFRGPMDIGHMTPSEVTGTSRLGEMTPEQRNDMLMRQQAEEPSFADESLFTTGREGTLGRPTPVTPPTQAELNQQQIDQQARYTPNVEPVEMPDYTQSPAEPTLEETPISTKRYGQKTVPLTPTQKKARENERIIQEAKEPTATNVEPMPASYSPYSSEADTTTDARPDYNKINTKLQAVKERKNRPSKVLNGKGAFDWITENKPDRVTKVGGAYTAKVVSADGKVSHNKVTQSVYSLAQTAGIPTREMSPEVYQRTLENETRKFQREGSKLAQALRKSKVDTETKADTELPKQPTGEGRQPAVQRTKTPQPSVVTKRTFLGKQAPDNSDITEKQKETGKYPKAKATIGGHAIEVENPKGSTRSGVNEEGEEWSNTLKDHYGYIKDTKGFDKDEVDVFIKESRNPSEVAKKPIFIVNQKHPKTGKFDEHKVMMGYSSAREAKSAYLRNYDKGWQGLDSIVKIDDARFKEWIENSEAKKGAYATKDDAMAPEAPVAKPLTKPKPAAKPAIEVPAKKDDIVDIIMPDGKKKQAMFVAQEGRQVRVRVLNPEGNPYPRAILIPAGKVTPSTAKFAMKKKLKPVEHADLLFTGSKPATNLSEEAVLKAIEETYGTSDFKNLNIISDPARKWRGMFVPTSKQIYLNAYYISKDEASRILNHEKVHQYLKTDKAFQEAMSKIVKKAKADPNSAAGMARIIAQRRIDPKVDNYNGRINEETIAYLIQYYDTPENNTLLSKLIESVRQFFNKKFGWNMNESDAVRYIEDLVQKEADKARGEIAISSKDYVESKVKELSKDWKNPPDITIYAKQKDMPLRIQDMLGDNTTTGFYVNGKVFLIAENMRSDTDIENTLFHETLGHYGLDQLFGSELPAMLDNMYTSLGGSSALSKIAKKQGVDLSAYRKALYDSEGGMSKLSVQDKKRILTEELLAHMSVENTFPNRVKKILGKVRSWLREHGFKKLLNYNDMDLLHVLSKAREAVVKGEFNKRRKRPAMFAMGTVTAHDRILDTDTEDYESFAEKTYAKPVSAYQRIMKDKSSAWSNLVNHFRTGFVDSYDALLRQDIDLFGKDVLSKNLEHSAYAMAKMSNAAHNALNTIINYSRITLGDDGLIKPIHDSESLHEIMKEVGDSTEIRHFMNWIAANRAAKLKAEDRENLFTDKEIRATVRINTAVPGRKQVWDKAYKKFNEHQRDVLAIAQKAGVLSKGEVEQFSKEFYVPFYRVVDEKEAGISTPTGLTRQRAYRKLKGGKEPLGDLLQNSIANMTHLIEASLKNQAGVKAIDNSLDAGVAEKIPAELARKGEGTYVLREGKKVHYNISDPLVYKAIVSLTDVGMQNFMMKTMRFFKRGFTGLTTSTPQFMMSNFLRDAVHTAAIGSTGKTFGEKFTAPFRGIRDYNKDNPLMQTMLASGGAFHFGHINANDADIMGSLIDDELRKTIYHDPKHLNAEIRKQIDRYRGIGNRLENANRFAVYEQALKEGKSELQAAFEARDLLDFTSKGAYPAVRWLVDIVPFLNARIQGLDVLYRKGLKPTGNYVADVLKGQDPNASDAQIAKRFSALSGSVMLMSMALFMAYKDDEDFKRRADWDKDMYWWFKIGDTEFRIPKPFEIGALGTMAERSLEQIVDESATGKLFAERFGHMLENTFSFNPVPQMFNPMVNLYANKDSFTDMIIESQGMKRLSPSRRTRANTTEFAKNLSAGLENTFGAVLGKESMAVLSPVQIDYLIQSYFGGIGAMANNVSNSILVAGLSGTGMMAEKPEKGILEYQPFRRFFKAQGTGNSRYIQDVYDKMRKANMVYADLRDLTRYGEIEKAQELIKDKKQVLLNRKLLNKASSTFTAINQQIKFIQKSDMTSKMKRKLIDDLQKQKERFAKMALGK